MTIEQIPQQQSALLSYEEESGLRSRLQRFAQDADAVYQVALRLATTPFVPTSYKKRGDRWLEPQEVAQTAAAAMLAGDEIGLSPMQALKAIDVIEGSPALNALSQRALVQAHGHEVWVAERRGGERRAVSVTVRGKRKGSDHIEEVTWSWDRATQARLTGKKNWQDNPEAMCVARATSEVCRLIAADVLMGLAYSSEELADGGEGAEALPVRVGVRQREEQPEQPQEIPAPSPEAEQPEAPAPEEAPQADTPAHTQPEAPSEPEPEEILCSQRKPEEPEKACSRPEGHTGRHHYGRTLSAEEIAALEAEQPEPEPEPEIVDPEASEPELAEGLADPEGPKRCPYYHDGQQCERESRHEGAHKAGDKVWGEEAEPARCEAVHPEFGRCSLAAGHEGQHEPEREAPSPAVEEEAVEAEIVEEEGEPDLFEQPSDAELEAALEAERAEKAAQAAAAEQAAEPEPAQPEASSGEDDDPWADFQ